MGDGRKGIRGRCIDPDPTGFRLGLRGESESEVGVLEDLVAAVTLRNLMNLNRQVLVPYSHLTQVGPNPSLAAESVLQQQILILSPPQDSSPMPT